MEDSQFWKATNIIEEEPKEPTEQRRFSPVTSTIDMVATTTEKLYSKLAPETVDQFLRESSIVSYGVQTATQSWNRLKPLVKFVDDCSDRVVGFGIYGYEHLLLESVNSVLRKVKKFYSCESNPYARVTLMFLTTVMSDPDLVSTTTEDQFMGLFRNDPECHQAEFQTIVKTFHQAVKNHWMGSKNCSKSETVRYILFVVATTMEQMYIENKERVSFFAQKYIEYFFHDETTPKTQHSRRCFREFTRTLLQQKELTADLVLMADQFLQIALVLFKLSNLGNSSMLDMVIDSIRLGKKGVYRAFRICQRGYSTVLLRVQVLPREAFAFAQEKTGDLVALSKDVFVAIKVRAKNLRALEYCIELAHKVDLLLREEGAVLLQILKKNRDILKAVVVTYREEIANFLETMPEKCSVYTLQARQALMKFLKDNASVVLDLAGLSKDTLEVLYETTTQFLLSNKQYLTDFCMKYGAVVLDHAKKGKNLAFSVLRIDEIASLAAKTFKAAEDYFRIKESLSKLDPQEPQEVDDYDEHKAATALYDN